VWQIAADSSLSSSLLVQVLLRTSFLADAAFNGRRVGLQSALLELAPATKRPTFAALNTVVIRPLAALPLLADLFLQAWPYPALLALTAGFVGLGAVWTRKL
jgi:hypothetical protein